MSAWQSMAGVGSVGDAVAANLAQWDERAPVHAVSPSHHVAEFAADPAYLSDAVRFDLPRLGDISGLHGVHLQCHIGCDTISLARLGAAMTGLDFSSAAIEQAMSLSMHSRTRVEFVVSEVHAAADVLGRGRFDLVFTGIGALCFVPEIQRWAGVVSDLLVPGGRLFLREGHPMLWALADPDGSGELRVTRPYFERSEPERWDQGGRYAASDAARVHTTSYEWNHGIGEIVTALLDHGMQIIGLVEHHTVPWAALPGMMVDVGGEFCLAEQPDRLAASFTLQARKNG